MSFDANAIMKKYGNPGLDDMTEEEWDEHDKRVRARLAVETARRRSQGIRARGKAIIACGAPDDDVEFVLLGKVDKAWDVMKGLEEWHKSKAKICVLSGPTGVGKTVAAVRWLMNYGGTSPAFTRGGDFEAQSRYNQDLRDHLYKATGLVMDDLSAEYSDSKGNFISDLDTLIDVYARGRGRLIVTTNLPWADEDAEDGVGFETRYGERIASRIVGNATWLNVVGKDRRRA